MSFCNYSSQITKNGQTVVSNVFMEHYLPNSQADCVKVYLFGLFLCGQEQSTQNTLEKFAETLNLSCEDVYSAFLYWQEQNLVTIVQTIPFSVKYLPLDSNIKKHIKIKDGKFTNFNLQIQEVLSGRMISPNEYYEYYAFLESSKMEHDALVMIAKFCTDIKGTNINYPYILKVAKDWAAENILTVAAVQEKLQGYEQKNSDLALVLKALAIKRAASIEERDLFEKWQAMSFELGAIIFVCKHCKKQKSANFFMVDRQIEMFYKCRAYTILDMEDCIKQNQNNFEIAKTITKNIGVYYQNLNIVIENYVMPWLSLGFEEQTLIQISEYAFKTNIKTLDMLDTQIQNFYKKGIVSLTALINYLQNIMQTEEEIAGVLQILLLHRNVTNFDRECYKNWTINWQFSKEMIEKAAQLSVGKVQSITYMNKILSNWHTDNITTVEQIKEELPKQKTAKVDQNFSGRDYTKQQLNSLFANIEDVEI